MKVNFLHTFKVYIYLVIKAIMDHILMDNVLIYIHTKLIGNVRVYVERMLMSARCYYIAHAYESIFEIHLPFVLIL